VDQASVGPALDDVESVHTIFAVVINLLKLEQPSAVGWDMTQHPLSQRKP
jgi:hypothetical protein